MSFNKSREWKKFLQGQRAQAKWYRSVGMSEAQIKAMFDFDLEVFNSMRRYATHTQPLTSENQAEDGMSPLLRTFPTALTYTIDREQDHSPYWWIEEIDTPAFVEVVKSLCAEDLLLLTWLCCTNLTQQDMANILGISQNSIFKRIRRLKKFFE